jgi:hypothetical protein
MRPASGLSRYVRFELALEQSDLVFEEELAFLEALQLELVLGGALREAKYDVIKVPVLCLQLIYFLLQTLNVGDMYHGRLSIQRYTRDSV